VSAQSRRCEEHSTEDSDPSPQIKIKIVSVEFQRDISLTDEDRAQILASIKRKDFWTDSKGTDDDWVTELQDVVRGTLQDEGYFKAVAEVHAHSVRAESQQSTYAVVVAIDSGPHYRLKEIHIVGATAFSPAEIREQFQLSPGEVFDVSKIRQGIETLTPLYGAKGYINFTAIPEDDVDERTGLVDLTINLDEGQQFRVGSVQILGLDEKAQRLLKSLPEPGQIYDNQILENFLRENESLLPVGPSPEDDISAQQHVQDGTIDLVFDFRRCSWF
jgi:outer membrane protein insertion porin family